jgi:tripartite-type tricarboxylate transporter receptor subunit TctC
MAAMASVPAMALAQGGDYPQRPIKLILGFPPGGATDTSARLMAQKMSEVLKQPIVVDNRPGASGNIAADAVARSAPDGYTLFYTTSTIHGINPNVFAKLPYDPVGDFAPVMYASRTIMVLVVRNDLGVSSTRELIQMAKSKPGKLTYASAGPGSTGHLAAALFCNKAGIDALHVPYKGSSPALTDLMSGQVDFTIDTLAATLPFIQAGKMRGLAVSGLERSPVLPDLPTIDASGVPGFNVAAWGGFLVPKGTPATIIQALNDAGNQAIRSPDVIARTTATGSEVKGGTAKEFGDFIRQELATWKLAVAAAGVPKQ